VQAHASADRSGLATDDDRLPDFDRSTEPWSEENERTSRTALAEHPEIYRNQLVVAKFIEDWATGSSRCTMTSYEWMSEGAFPPPLIRAERP